MRARKMINPPSIEPGKEEASYELVRLRERSSEEGISSSIRSDGRRNVLTEVCLFILVTEMCERLAFYGFSGTLLSFFTAQLGLDSVFASEMTALFAAIVHLTPILGGWVADQYLNRYRTIGTFLIVYMIGLILVAFAAWPGNNFFNVALLGLLGFVAVGAGGIKANVVTFGADQFKNTDPHEVKQREKFFGYFYMTINVGALFSFGYLSNLSFNPEFFSLGLVPQNYGYFATYIIPLVFLALACVIFFIGTNRYKIIPASNSAFQEFVRVFIKLCMQDTVGIGKTLLLTFLTLAVAVIIVVASFFVDNDNLDFILVVTGMCLIFLSSAFLVCACRDVEWLDRLQISPKMSSNLDATAVTNVRDTILLMPYFGLLVMFFVGYSQMTGNFQLQACQMDMRIGSVIFSPAFLNIFDCATIIVAVPLLNQIVYPFIEAKIERKILPLEKMFAGFLCMSFAMLLAGFVEGVRMQAKDLAIAQGFVNGVHDCCSNCTWSQTGDECRNQCGNVTVPLNGVDFAFAWKTCEYNSLCGGYKPMKNLSIWYQLFVYVLVGLGETFSSVAAYDLFYNEVGKEIRSVSQGVNLMTYAFGSFAAGGLNEMLQKWLPNNLNQEDSGLQHIFLAISIMTLSVAFILRFISHSYIYKNERKPYKLLPRTQKS